MDDHLAGLKQAATAARVSLSELVARRDALSLELSKLVEPIDMLSKVVAAWELLDPTRGEQQSILPPITPQAESEKKPYGQISSHVRDILADGREYTLADVVHLIAKRFNVRHELNAVRVAIKRGIDRQEYIQAANGKYLLSPTWSRSP